MKYADSVLDLVGSTPLVRLNSVTRGIRATVLAKLEYMNPGGSIKDRIAVSFVADAEASGQLRPGGTIVEPTSGNTGVGLAMVAAIRGYDAVFVTPDKVGKGKRDVLSAYGAEVVVTKTNVAPDSPESYYGVTDRLTRERAGAFKPDQFSNQAGPAAHYRTTGPEIWNDTEGRVSHVVMGPGTGGTITGTGRYLHEASDGRVRVIAADPAGSIYADHSAQLHGYYVEGVGEETADAISLYCFSRPAFLCDEYARRTLRERGAEVPGTYRAFARALVPALEEAAFTVPELAELHGLIVEEGKLRARPAAPATRG